MPPALPSDLPSDPPPGSDRPGIVPAWPGPPPWGPEPSACIVGLAGAIARRFSAAGPAVGVPHDDPKLAGALAGTRHVVLLLLDGFGLRQLDTLVPGGALASCRRSVLRSVFPASTAPAITSFATARFPAQHANPGWFCWSREAGAIIRTLPMDVRGEPERTLQAEPIWDWRSASLDFSVPVVAVQPQYIADSVFSRHAWAGARRVGYQGVDDLEQAVAAAIAEHPAGCFVWAYLPQFDSISHERGWQSPAAAAVASRFDHLFERLAARLAASGALLLASADHGFVDVPAEQQLRLEDFPAVAALLERPLAGEPRTVYCQVPDEAHEAFDRAVRESLGHAFEVARIDELVAAGWFGPGPVSPRLQARIGSHVLIGRDRYTLVDRVPGEPEPAFVGMHGGIHPDELQVPLLAAWRGAAL